MEIESAGEKSTEKRENLGRAGKLIVIAGRSGSGKDYLMDLMLNCDTAQERGMGRVVTCASRAPRNGEQHGVDYYFITQEELFALHDRGELVEEPVATGSSFKGTTKSELSRVLEGCNLVWRIDLSRAADVAGGDFFDRLFDKETAVVMRLSTVVILVDVDQETLIRRRQSRDGDLYDEKEYEERDRQELQILAEFGNKFDHVVENKDGETEQTKKLLEELLCNLLD